MTAYIIKVILCSALFIFAYKALLETEKAYRFNRFYLLISLVLSFYIPTITFSYTPDLPALKDALSNISIVTDSQPVRNNPSPNSQNNYSFMLLVFYLTVTTLLLVRFGINLATILRKALSNPVIPFEGAKIVLVPEDVMPHTFYNRVFINKEAYLNGKIEKEILVHELTHVRQSHFADILFIEMLQAFFWFNPALFLYRKALRLNHEFLADEAAVKASRDPIGYQCMLIEKANQPPGSPLTSQLNYLITKKRLVMISKQTSRAKAMCKQTAAIGMLAISIFLFSTKSFSQDTSNVPKVMPKEAPSTKEGVSAEWLNEYDQLVRKLPDELGNFRSENLSDAERSRLETIFLSMSKDQQEKQTIILVPVPPPLPRTVPTDKQIASWKNASIYGLWIDNKRVSNTALNKYRNTDFAQVFVSKLSKNAINYGKHYYQVNLMTTDNYDTYYKQTTEKNQKTKYYIMRRRKITKPRELEIRQRI